MSRVPIPQQGQPLDLSYISTLATAVNELSEEGAALAQGNNFIFQGGLNNTPASYKLYGAQIFAQEVSIEGGTTELPERIVSFSPYNFSTPPVVTATLVASSNNEAIVSLKNITSSSATVLVKFPTSEGNSARVSIIAIGVPSNIS
jgi:hypothetical protein